MTVFKSITDVLSRIVRALVAPSKQSERPLTEDDIRTDRFLRAHQARG